MSNTAKLIKNVKKGSFITSTETGVQGINLLAVEDMRAGDLFTWDDGGRARRAICDRDGCPWPMHGNHYHCSRCTSAEVTSMLGHYRSVDGRDAYTCKPEDLPAKKDVVGCPCGNYEADEEDCTECMPPGVRLVEDLENIARSAESNGGHVTPDEVETIGKAAEAIKQLMENPLKLVGQVVTTEAELEALPDESVIVGRGDKFENEHSDTSTCVWQKDWYGLWHSWWYKEDGFTSLQLITAKFLPARYTVVWMPPAEETKA